MDSLKTLMYKTDCEGIFIHYDRSISVRYDGHGFCQYEYYLPRYYYSLNELMLMEGGGIDYEKIELGIYAGLRRYNLFCGYVIYDK